MIESKIDIDKTTSIIEEVEQTQTK